jgi:tRNA(Ile)-lysidine synthase
LLERVACFIKENRLILEGQRVMAGVSGGMDSVALLHLLCALRTEFGFVLQAAHFNHGIREESAEEERFVTELCSCWDVPVFVGSADVPALAVKRRCSIEVAAREARHAFFRETMAQYGADRLALAHHADDQAETVLLRLLRGSGAMGLGAMAPANGHIIRPLLCIGRQDIAAYCRDNTLTWREDKSNRDTAIPRNWIRMELLPRVRERLNPEASQAICRAAALLRQDEAFFRPLAEEALRDAVPCGGGWAVSVASFTGLHPAVRSRALRLLCGRAGRSRDVGLANIADIEALLAQGMSGRRVDLGGGAVALREAQRLIVLPEMPCAMRFSLPVAVPGETPTPLGMLRMTPLDAPPEELLRHSPLVQYADADALPGGIVARTRLPGDTIHPLGAPGRRKLQDFLTDRKIGRWQRDSLLLLAHGSDVLWVAGYALSDSLKITKQTKNVIKFEIYTDGEEQNIGEHE